MMNDLPAQGLLQQMHARQVSGEHLEVLGKQAAAAWGRGDFSTLTAAVTETVKHAGLSPEQVRRVVEFTNTEAFQKEFKKEGAHRVVDFPGGPANASEILRDFNDGGGGTVFDRGSADYAGPPTETKVASVQAEEALFSLLSGSNDPLPDESPYSEVLDLRDKLAAAHDHLVASISGVEIMFADLSERVYDGVKQASLGGLSLGSVLQAWSSIAPSEEYLKVAFEYLSPRLLNDQVFDSLKQMSSSIDKTAGARFVNQEHPLVVDFKEYCEALSKLAELRAQHAEVAEELGRANIFIKKAASEGLYHVAKRGLQTGGRVAGEAAARLTELAAGEGEHVNKAREYASKGVRYGVPLLAANEVRRHLKYSPAFQAVKNTALSAVPMTPQYQQREYEIATGQ